MEDSEWINAVTLTHTPTCAESIWSCYSRMLSKGDWMFHDTPLGDPISALILQRKISGIRCAAACPSDSGPDRYRQLLCEDHHLGHFGRFQRVFGSETTLHYRCTELTGHPGRMIVVDSCDRKIRDLIRWCPAHLQQSHATLFVDWTRR